MPTVASPRSSKPASTASSPATCNVPAYYVPERDSTTTAGVYGNLAFEGLALSRPTARRLWASTENALAQDGDKATLEAGSPSRLISFDLSTGEPKAE